MTQSKVVQITNIAPQATRDQMQTLFGYLGKLEDMRLYPTVRDVAVPVQSRICYVKFHDPICVGIALHMTNTVFIDRAIIVVPFESEIPDEQRALELTNHGTMVPGLFPIHPKLPRNVTNQLQGVPPNQVVITSDPRLDEKNLPLYPPLPATLDARRVEEIRRTLVISNLDRSLSPQQVIDIFNTAGEVKYLRFCSREDDPGHYALIEFSDQTSIVPGLQMNGKEFGGSAIKVSHATQAIVKPQAKSSEDVQKEIEEAMSRVKEAQNLISAAIDPVIGLLADDKKKRSRSGSRSRRSRSLSRGRRRSHSRSRRSRSRSRRRSRNRHSRSRSRRRSHSRSKHRSRSRDRKRRSRSPRHHRSHSRSRSRSRRRSRSRSRSTHSKSKTKSSSKNYDKKDRKDEKKDSKKESGDRKDGDSKEEKEVQEAKDVETKDEKERDGEKSKSKDKDKYREKSKSSRKSSSRSPSKSRHRSPRRKSRSPSKKRSPTRKKSPHSRRKSHSPSRRRSSSHSRRRSKSPRSSHSRHSPAYRSPSHSKSRRDDKKKERERSHDTDRHDKEDKKRREKKEEKEEKSSSLKVSRNYEEEIDGDAFDSHEQERNDEERPESNPNDDNDGDGDRVSENHETSSLIEGKEVKQNAGSVGDSNADDMDISTSP